MSIFTRENFSYPKIAVVIGSGIAFIVLGILGSEKGIVIGPIICPAPYLCTSLI